MILFLLFLDIEDLTHKTGNFKQFKVFVNMLESALNKVRKHKHRGNVDSLAVNTKTIKQNLTFRAKAFVGKSPTFR